MGHLACSQSHMHRKLLDLENFHKNLQNLYLRKIIVKISTENILKCLPWFLSKIKIEKKNLLFYCSIVLIFQMFQLVYICLCRGRILHSRGRVVPRAKPWPNFTGKLQNWIINPTGLFPGPHPPGKWVKIPLKVPGQIPQFPQGLTGIPITI